MNSLHVVKEVVATGKAVTWNCSLTVPEVAQMGPGAVTVHAMSFPLMTKKAGGGRELHTNACLLITAEGLQVRVHVFVVVALQRGRLVVAASLALLRAAILSVFVRQLLVQRVAAGDLGALLL